MNENKSTVRHVLGQFFKTTTLHGFKYLWSDFYLDRIAWVICCSASTCCAGLLCAVLWARFLEVPAVLELRDLRPNHQLPRYTPDIAVCAPTHTLVSSFLKKLNVNASMESRLSTSIQRVLAGKPAAEDQVRALEQLLSSENMTLSEVVFKHSASCEDLMITCRWQRVTVRCNVLFEKELTGLGPCCVMHPDRAYYRLLNETVRPTARFSHSKTLDLSLQCSNETIYGCKFFVKYKGESNVQSTVLAPGYIYFATVMFVSVPMSSSEFLLNDCISDKSYSEEICQYKCAEKNCGCSDPLHEVEVEEEIRLPPCSVAHLGCLKAYKHQSTKEIKENFTCKCLPSCNKMTSTISLETTPMNFETFTVDPIYNGLNAKSSVIHMRLNIPISKIFSLNPTETWLTLLSSLGGVFNMFLGVGLFSALEILCLLLFKLPTAFLHSPFQ